MKLARAMAIFPLIIAMAFCAACATVDSNLSPDENFSGIGYWKYGVGSRLWYSFHWYGDTILVRDGFGNADTYTIAASACIGLNEAMAQLLNDVKANVAAIVDSSPMPPPEEILIDAPQHRLVYHPQGQSDRLELSGFEEIVVQPWIKTAQVVRRIISGSRDS